jgi:large subunit ribosomal protein L17
MRHQRQRYQLSRSASHRKALLINLIKEVIDHERIQTTEAKAKAVKPEVEKLITLAKRGDLHARRQALSALGQDKFAVYKLFEEIAPRYTERPGGYTRIVKLGPRGVRPRPGRPRKPGQWHRSDSTEMVLLELV